MNLRALFSFMLLAFLSLSGLAAEQNYIASRDQGPFHLRTCKWADNILAKNVEYFESVDEAIAAGHSPCVDCNPGVRSSSPVPMDYPRWPPGVTRKNFQRVTFLYADSDKIVCSNPLRQDEPCRFALPVRLRAQYSVDEWARGSEVDLWTYQGIGSETVSAAVPYQIDKSKHMRMLGRELNGLLGWKISQGGFGPVEMYWTANKLAMITVGSVVQNNVRYVDGSDLPVSGIAGRLIAGQPQGQCDVWYFISGTTTMLKGEEVALLITLQTPRGDPDSLLNVFKFWLQSVVPSEQ